MVHFSAVFRIPDLSRASGDSAKSNTAGIRASAESNHLFANNVRFLSMAAIIALHAQGSYPALLRQASYPIQTSYPLWLLYAMQPLKFGTIGFFLISGFLLGERIDRYSSVGYYTRRLRNVFVPWCVWFLLFCCMPVLADLLHHRLSGHFAYLWPQLWAIGTNCLFESAFWFVPNLFVALAVLLLFRRVAGDLRIGLVFLLASLFYAVNIYGHWFAARHTRAAFGFVFYLWLGSWTAKHFPAVEKWLARIPIHILGGLLLITNLLAVAEMRLLCSLNSVDPLNSLRITNQIYSVVAVLLIVRLRRPAWPGFVDVRAHTFGLYLTHMIGLTILVDGVAHFLPHLKLVSFCTSVAGTLLLITAQFAITYGGCLLLVRGLLSYPWLRWTVGLPGQRPRERGRQPDAHHSAGPPIPDIVATAAHESAPSALPA